MKKEQLKSLINDLLKEQLKGITSISDGELLTGYNPLEKIRGGLFWWIAVPFNGIDVWCQLRCPNATQIEQCGDVTNIVIEKYKDLKEGEQPAYEYEEIIQIRNHQEELCKIVFNKHPGRYCLQIIGNNNKAKSFWTKLIDEVGTEVVIENDGTIYTFLV